LKNYDLSNFDMSKIKYIWLCNWNQNLE
jgi:hypothetical protein